MDSGMLSDIPTVVLKLKERSYPSHRFQLFVVYLNKELARTDDDLYGMIVHAGSFSTKEKANDARIKLCSDIRGPAITMCTSGCPVPLTLHDKNNIVFGADVTATAQELEDAARECINRKEEEARRQERELSTNEGKFVAIVKRLAEIESTIETLRRESDTLLRQAQDLVPDEERVKVITNHVVDDPNLASSLTQICERM